MKKLLMFFIVAMLLLASTTMGFATTSEVSVNQSELERQQNVIQEVEDNLEAVHSEIEKYKIQNNNTINTRGVSYNGFKYLDGDILITNNTSSYGIIGHAGIIVGNKVLDITPKYEGIPTEMSMNTWFSRYPSTMVLRYDSGRNIPVNAAWYGSSYYVEGDGRDNTYSATSSITSRTEDYCSSLVWKCYHFGANFDFKVYVDSPGQGPRLVVPSVILPYDFINYRTANGFSAVHSENW